MSHEKPSSLRRSKLKRAWNAITTEDGSVTEYEFPSSNHKEVAVSIGQLMQWTAGPEGLVYYEICEPPYQDGRFENLPD